MFFTAQFCRFLVYYAMLLQNVCRRREGVFKKGEFGATSPKVDNLRQKGLILKLYFCCAVILETRQLSYH